MDRRSPLERMIDQACGFDHKLQLIPDTREDVITGKRPDLVIMRCSLCATEKIAARHDSDPKQAVFIVFPCPKCLRAAKGEVRYFGADGAPIVPSWQTNES